MAKRTRKAASVEKQAPNPDGHPRNIKKVEPRNDNQAEYLQQIEDHRVVIGYGPAGCGKTYLAVYQALRHHWRKQDKAKRIVIARPIVEAGERLGYLPGDIEDKVDPYMRPIYDSLYDFLGIQLAKDKISKGYIEIAPLAYMRGRTFKDSFVIIDEAQNASLKQLKMATTRIGENSKMIITGDPYQSDLPRNQDSGLQTLVRILEKVPAAASTHFVKEDIVRDPIVQDIVSAFELFENENNT